MSVMSGAALVLMIALMIVLCGGMIAGAVVGLVRRTRRHGSS
jgi:hypothetical protein